MRLVKLLRLDVLLRSIIWHIWVHLWVLKLRGHFLLPWNGGGHAYYGGDFSFVSWRSCFCMGLLLALVIIIISISINTLRWLHKVNIITVRILVICILSWFSWTVLRITLIELLCHWLIYCLSNCAVLWAIASSLTHKVMIVHIFLNTPRRSEWVIDIALVDFLNLLNVSFYHIKICGFKLFSFL